MERERQRKERHERKEAEEKKRREEEEKRREEELKEVESDHHGRIYIDYALPRAKYVPQNYDFSQQILVGKGTFASVYMCTIGSTQKVVALKKLHQDKKYKSRELQIHKEMHH